MQFINVLSVAPDVNNWLANSRLPRILYVFDRACNLINEPREVLSIVTPQIGNGPFNLVMPIQMRRTHPKVKGHAGKVALTRGPLVYCLESVDNPEVDIFTAQLDPSSLRDEFFPDLLGGTVAIHGRTTDGAPLKFIPYFLWANRGESQMTVWANCR